jgi:hypothetical protein
MRMRHHVNRLQFIATHEKHSHDYIFERMCGMFSHNLEWSAQCTCSTHLKEK